MRAHPNILIVMTDGQRRDATGFINRDPVYTPHLDAFAREGAACENMVTNSPLCTPARACFLTGKHPGTLTGPDGAVNMLYNWQRLPEEEETFAKAATRAGYDTALIGKWHLDDWEPGEPGNHWVAFTPPGERRMGFRFWYSNGCCHNHFRLLYNDTENMMHDLGEGWQVDHETDITLRYLRNRAGERPADKPFCLWLNFGPPHNECGDSRPPIEGLRFNYAAPETDEAIYRDQYLPRYHPGANPRDYAKAAPGYFGEVSAVDRAFGRILATLDEEGLRENTIVVFTSDHGEMLSINNRWIKDIWYEQSIGVPFVIRWHGEIAAGLRVRRLLGLVDVFPTLMELAGIPFEPGRHGTDFSAWLREADAEGDAPSGETQFLAYNTGAPPPELTRYEFPREYGRSWRGVRTPTHTYVAVDQHPDAFNKFYNRAKLPDALPPDATCLAYDLVEDPWQQSPLYPGTGRDALLDQLHAVLAGFCHQYGDHWLETHWSPERRRE